MKIKKELRVQTKDEIVDHIIGSITDFDIGWATVDNVASNGTQTEFILKPHFWNTADQSFKVTVEEIK